MNLLNLRLGCNDMDKARAFYDATFGALGLPPSSTPKEYPIIMYKLPGGPNFAVGPALRFGTWIWGLGMNDVIFTPKKTGANFDLPEEIQSLAPIQKHINLFSNVTAFRDTYENLCHYSGWVILTTGQAPRDTNDIPGETLDVTIANEIGRALRAIRQRTILRQPMPAVHRDIDNGELHAQVILPSFALRQLAYPKSTRYLADASLMPH